MAWRPLGLVDRTDIYRRYDGFSAGARREFNRDRLLITLLELYDEHPDGVRYRLIRRRLLDGGALENARIKP